MKFFRFLVKKYDKLGKKLEQSKVVEAENYHEAKKRSKLRGFIKVRKIGKSE